MRKSTTLLLFLLLLVSVCSATELKEKLQQLNGVLSVTEMENNEFFQEAYILMVEQPLDHDYPEMGTFAQRVILSHLGYEKPSVFVTEGYGAEYTNNNYYLNELSLMLDANQIVCEHRYFGESMPDKLDYKYLTVENAAADHHRLIQLLKQVYTQKWITTGISKGGQTTLFHRMLYPNDVDISVPYVAPVNFSNQEKRHITFLEETVGTATERKRILNFQHELMERKEKLLPLFTKYCKKDSLSFTLSHTEIFDYCVLEYPFALWQWGTDRNEIPNLEASDEEIFTHFRQISSPNYFSIEGTEPILSFFIQAQHELGYYAYNYEPFKDQMAIEGTKNYLEKIFIPSEDMQFPYKSKLSKRTKKFLQKDAERILLVYGEWDPWSATAADIGQNKNIYKYVQPEGSHKARLLTLPIEKQEEAVNHLKEWLAE